MAFHQVCQKELEAALCAVCCRSFLTVSDCTALFPLPHPQGFLKDRRSIFLFTVSISILISLNQALRINEIPSVRGFAERVTSHPPRLYMCELSCSFGAQIFGAPCVVDLHSEIAQETTIVFSL